MNVYFIEWNANYEKLMLQNLSILGVIDKKRVMKHFTKNNIKLKKTGISNAFFVKIHAFFKLREIEKNDMVVCNGYSILGILDLIKQLDCKKVLVIRDTMIHLERGMRDKKKWLAQDRNFIEEVKPHFDKIYSFDPLDCERYGLTYLNQFLPYTYENIIEILKKKENTQPAEKRCFFVGEYREEREQCLYTLHTHFAHCGYTSDFYLLDRHQQSKNYPSFCKNQSLDYDENIKKVIDSNVIIEINHHGQNGLTLRTIEALAFNKKIITNNTHVMNYEFYSPAQFFILGYDNIESLPQFLAQETPTVPVHIVQAYTADHMLNTLISNVEH